MIEIEFRERRDGSKVAGVKIGNTVYAMTCEEWRIAAVEIVSQISAYLEKEGPQGDDIVITCEYCRHPFPVDENFQKTIKILVKDGQNVEKSNNQKR